MGVASGSVVPSLAQPDVQPDRNLQLMVPEHAMFGADVTCSGFGGVM
jgi:hypothetical protein